MDTSFFPSSVQPSSKVMIFIDGENLAIRYGEIISKAELEKQPHVEYEESIYVWSKCISEILIKHDFRVIRNHYYTSVIGNDVKSVEIEDKLKNLGIESPVVFKKRKGKKSKRVDITLAVDMLSHAHKKNFDVAVLISGDEDFVPLVKAVRQTGRSVVIWFFSEGQGLSDNLRRSADHYFNIGDFLLNKERWERGPRVW